MNWITSRHGADFCFSKLQVWLGVRWRVVGDGFIVGFYGVSLNGSVAIM
jgi:hypothetical protein